jgi:CubicO group peptidase (beta-lactamase class C family)
MRGAPALLPRLLPALAVAALPLAAQPTPAASRAGFSPARLARIDTLLAEAARTRQIGGAVALVLRDDQVVYQRAVGWRDREAGRAMVPDAIFRIASQTKALTSAAILMLVDEGKLTLGTPVSRFFAGYARPLVAVRGDTGAVLVPARRAITVRDLLTHTAGISYGTDAHVAERYRALGLGPAAGFGWYTADKDEPVCETMDRLATLPLVAQPGEAWVYGYNTDLLGCIVERVSGMALDAFLRTRLTAPLGMTDTHFFLPTAQRDRLVTVYASSGDTVVRAPEGARGPGHYVDGPRRNFAGGAGLVATARDYARFLQMIARGGTWGGRRYLSDHAVALMRTNQVGTLHGTAAGFGLGFETVEQYGAADLASRGAYGWGGAYSTSYRIDPAEGLILVFMINQLPNNKDVATRFQTMVYAALDSARATGR